MGSHAQQNGGRFIVISKIYYRLQDKFCLILRISEIIVHVAGKYMYHELIHCVLFGITYLQYNSLHRIWAHEFCWMFFSLFWVKLGRVNNASEGGTVQRPLSEVNNNLTAWHMSVQLLTSSGKLYSTPSIVQYISGFVSFKKVFLKTMSVESPYNSSQPAHFYGILYFTIVFF